MRLTIRLWAGVLCLLICLFSGIARAGQVVALGAKVKGELTADNQPVGWSFDAIAGTQVTISIKGKNGLKPQIQLQDESTFVLLTTSALKKTTAKITSFVLPKSGRFFVRVTGLADGPVGPFSGTTSFKVDKSLLSFDSPLDSLAGQSFGLPVALPGMVMSGSVTLTEGVLPPAGVPFFTITGPSGELDLSGKLKFSKDSKKATFKKKPVLAEFGAYILSPSSADQRLSAKLKFTAPTIGATTVVVAGGPTFLQVPPPKINPVAPLTTVQQITLTGTAKGAVSVNVQGPLGVIPSPVVDGGFAVAVPLKANAVNNLYVTAIPAEGTPSAPSSVQVTMDNQPPGVSILFPQDGAKITTSTITVSGTVGDFLSGTKDLQVLVNDQPANVSLGIGTNGTFELTGVPLNAVGPTVIKVDAADAAANIKSIQITVEKIPVPPEAPKMVILSGNSQAGIVGTELAQPLVVKLTNPNGSALTNKLVKFKIIRNDGRLATTAGQTETGKLETIVPTDPAGEVRMFWRLGNEAGFGNNLIEVTSTDVVGSAFFCANASAKGAKQINIGRGNDQRVQVGAPLPMPLVARVTDGQNPVKDVQVSFKVVKGGGKVNDADVISVVTNAAGAAIANFTTGLIPGEQLVEATFVGNAGLPATFRATAIVADSPFGTTFSGVVQDNALRPIYGARCRLTVAGTQYPDVISDPQGRFEFKNMPTNGIGDLWVYGSEATQVGGQAVPIGTFPTLHFENIVIVPNGRNSIGMPVMLPMLDPANKVLVTTELGSNGNIGAKQDYELKCKGIDGLRMNVKKGTVIKNPTGGVVAGTISMAVDQVHFDEIPMPLPDGRVTRFAATLQPGGYRFDPPISFEIPNTAGLAPGAISYLFSFNHDTGNFEIIGTGSVSADGGLLVSDPGSGISVAGWHGAAPPPPPTGDADNDPCHGKKAEGQALAAEIAKLLSEAESFANQAKSIEDSISTWTILACTVGLGLAALGVLKCLAAAALSPLCLVVAIGGLVLGVGDCALHSDSFYQKVVQAEVLNAKAAAKYAQAIAKFAELNFVCTGLAIDPWLKQKAQQIKPLIDGVDAALAEIKSKLQALGDKLKQAQELIQDAQDILDDLLSIAQSDASEDELRLVAEQISVLLTDASDLSAQIDSSTLLIKSTEKIEAYQQVSALALLGDATVTMGGQSGAVDSTGSYQLQNVPAGPALVAPLITVSDGLKVLYGRQEFGRILQNETALFQADVLFSTTPPPTPLSLTSGSGAEIETISLGQSKVLVTKAKMSTGVEAVVQGESDGTWYSSTNELIATVDANGKVEAKALGTAYVTASNQGATTVQRVDVVVSSSGKSISGVVRFADGSPVSGAQVSTLFGSTVNTATDGSFTHAFSVSSTLPSVLITVTKSQGAATYQGSKPVQLSAAQIIDGGVITVFLKCTNPTWISPSSGLNGPVNGFGAHQGSIYAGGQFTTAGTATVSNLARWDGQQWHDVGGGVLGAAPFPTGWVNDVESFTDPISNAAKLYVGGWFKKAGGATASSIASWSNGQWDSMLGGVNGTVNAMTVFDDGSGPALFVGGSFSLAGGTPALNIAKWDGASWSAVGTGANGAVETLVSHDPGDGLGSRLYVGGDFFAAGGVPALHIAAWDGQAWSGLGLGASDTVLALASFDANDGLGPRLYAGGKFSNAGGKVVNYFASWDGLQWSAIGNGFDNWVQSLVVHNDRTTLFPELFIGGQFTKSGTTNFSRIAKLRWNQTTSGGNFQFNVLGTGLDDQVFALGSYNDGTGTGPFLFVGGGFDKAGTTSVGKAGKWGCLGN